MDNEQENEIDELINKIRGTTPSSELQKEVETLIKADEAKAKIKIKADKKRLQDIKKAEKKLREEAELTEEPPPTPPERDKTGKFTKKEPETPEEIPEEKESETAALIKKMTEQMDGMAEEIAALKNRKNYRTPPPKGEKVEDPDDFIRQNITKDFEMKV